MPIRYTIDESRKRVETTVTGHITVLDIVGHLQVAHQEGFLPYKEMIDASSITTPTMTVLDLWKAATTVRSLNYHDNPGSRAVLVANDTIFGLTYIFTSLVTGYFPIKTFRDPVAAENWLNEQGR